MKLIVGLGNPGIEYQYTRHNFAWLVLDKLAEKHLARWQQHKKDPVETTQLEINNEKILLAKPLTFMNNSGLAVSLIKKFYKIKKENIIIIYDDIALQFGKIKISYNRSAGGHNGLASVIEHLKSKEFNRLRLGIGPQTGVAEKFVLQKFNPTQKKQLAEIIDTSHLAIETMIKDGQEIAANIYN